MAEVHQVAGKATTSSQHTSSANVEKDQRKRAFLRSGGKPRLLKLRSSEVFITFVVGYGIFVDLAIYGLASPVIPFRLRQLGYTNVSSLTGWLVAAYAGGLIVSSPIIGYLGEKTKSRQMPLLISLLFMVGALVMFMLSKSFALLLVSRILQGISGTAIFSLGFALLADCVPEDKIALASGNAMIGLSLGSVVGPPIGGALYDRLGYYAPWICAMILVAFDFVFRIAIIEPHRAARWSKIDVVTTAQDEKELEGSAGPQVKTPSPLMAFLKLSYNPRALASMAISVAFGVFFGTLDSALTLRLNQRYGLSSQGAGLVFISFAVPALFFSPLAGWLADKYGSKPVALLGVIAVCPFIALLAIDKMNLVAFVAVLAFVGAAASFPLPPCSADLAAVVRETPGLGYCHAFSYFNLSFSVGSFIGPVISGQVLQALGIEKGWFTMIGISIVFFLLSVPLVVLKYPAWGRLTSNKQHQDAAAPADSSENVAV